jgi:NADH:ubiquinone oxidoreductase subunit 6 (subunit J)
MADFIFLGMMVITVGGAIMALEAREIVYGAVALAASFFGVASLFFLLDAPFVAAFQLTVYVGAVAILVLFTVMLVHQPRWFKDASFRTTNLVGILTAAGLAISLVASFAASSLLLNVTEPATAPNFVEIGRFISTQFSPALEVLALVLASAVIGAIVLSKVDRPAEGEEATTRP